MGAGLVDTAGYHERETQTADRFSPRQFFIERKPNWALEETDPYAFRDYWWECFVNQTPRHCVYRIEHKDSGLGPCQHPGPGVIINYGEWRAEFTFKELLSAFYKRVPFHVMVEDFRFGHKSLELIHEVAHGAESDLRRNGYGIATYHASHFLILQDQQCVFIRDCERTSFRRF